MRAFRACVIFVLDAALQRLGSERLVDAASAMTDSMASCIDTTPLGERGDVLGGHPAEVAVLLNDARAALQSDRAFARTCVVRALELLREDPAPSCPHGGLAAWQIRRLLAHIEARLDASIRVVDLAALVRLSTSHFSRAFKQSFGQAPMTYVSLQRVRLAQRLLLTTDDSLCQISLACGMCDQAHLTRVFRRIVGDSPMAWRRRHAMGPPPPPAMSRHASR